MKSGHRLLTLLLASIAAATVVYAQAHAEGILDRFRIGKPNQKLQHPFKPHPGIKNAPPPVTLIQLANLIDILEEGIRDDGTLVLQQPSVWGQARMTIYRSDFEKEMASGLDDFAFILSARVARTDQASFESQTNLAATLTRGAPGSAITLAPDKVLAERDKVAENLSSFATQMIKATEGKIDRNEAFALFDKVFRSVGQQSGNLGLEPTVFLDEKKRYLDHLNELRRVNLGDDIADSAGYGLYLVRMPVSLEPGEKTRQGHGGILTATAEHEFGPYFLQRTFRNLVINDLLDQLTPIVFEIVDHDLDTGIHEKMKDICRALGEYEAERSQKKAAIENFIRSLPGKTMEGKGEKSVQELDTKLKRHFGTSASVESHLMTLSDEAAKSAMKMVDAAIAELSTSQAKATVNRLNQQIAPAAEKLKRIHLAPVPASIVNGKTYPIAPTDQISVFAVPAFANVTQEPGTRAFHGFIDLLKKVRDNQHTERARATDIRLFLQRELEAAYDIMERGLNEGLSPLCMTELFTEIVSHFRKRQFDKRPENATGSLEDDFGSLMGILQNKLHCESMGMLCWTIAVDAALLNERLREDMDRVFGKCGFQCPHDLMSLYFYLPPSHARTDPGLWAAEAFAEYVKTRWPIITFSLDPVVDQQNIADALSLRRDLRLAVAFAFATGRISFQQFTSFQRRIEQDAETIALNRTVTAFSHGNDTFGWRFCPRYQNPPPQTNAKAAATLLYRTAPGPNYQLNKSQLERGQRELTVVMVMPSFLNTIRLDVRGNWFKLTNPDDLILPTGRMLEQGRFVQGLMSNQAVCDAHLYRPQDVRTVHLKLKQLEKMLPVQTYDVNVPYENTLGGFDLFVPGTTALAPLLLGYEGVDLVPTCKLDDKACSETSIMLYGKHFSIHETKVVAGGKFVPDTDFQILSRQVARLKMPKDVRPTEIRDERGNRKFIEIHLATPNGISNRLLVPFEAEKPAPPPAPEYALKTTELTIRYFWTATKGGQQVSLRPLPAATTLKIERSDKATGVASKSVKVSFQFKSADGSIDINPADRKNLTAIANGKKSNTFTIEKDDVDKIATEILQALTGTATGEVRTGDTGSLLRPDQPNGPEVLSEAIVIVPSVDDEKNNPFRQVGAKAGGQLKVKVIFSP